jgi:hypothetical protein
MKIQTFLLEKNSNILDGTEKSGVLLHRKFIFASVNGFFHKDFLIEHDHSTCSCSLAKRKIAFCDKKITILIVADISELFVNLKGYSGVEFDIFLNGIQQIGAFFCPKFMNVLIGALYKGFVLLMVVQQADIGMLRNAHIMDEVERCAEIKHRPVEISGFPKPQSTGVIINGQIHCVFPAIQALLLVWVIKMIGAFEILICPDCSSIDICDIAQEKVIFLFTLVIPENLHRLNINEFVDFALRPDNGLFYGIGNPEYKL